MDRRIRKSSTLSWVKRHLRTLAWLPAAILALSSAVAAPPAFAAPGNDGFASAQVLAGNGGSTGGTNVDATGEVGEPNHAGHADFAGIGGVNDHSVWYAWTPTVSGVAVVDLCTADYDSILAAYTGSAVNALSEVTSNDDACGAPDLNHSRVAFSVASSTTYHVAVDGYLGRTGTFTLAYSIHGNDDFANAESLAGNTGSVVGTNTGATGETDEPNHAGVAGGGASDHSVWYEWTPAAGRAAVDVCTSDYDTVLAAYTGGAFSDPLTVVASNDNSTICGPSLANSSIITFDADGTSTYRIAVDRNASSCCPSEGTFTLGYSIQPDSFSAPQTLPGNAGFAIGTNVGATGETDEPNHATLAGGGVNDHSVWYDWTPSVTGTGIVDTCSADFDTVLAAYTGATLSALTEQASNDDTSDCPGGYSKIALPVTSSTTYHIAVDGNSSPDPSTGVFKLSYTVCTAPNAPTNLTAVAGNGSATVSWTPGAANGCDITSYTITGSPGGSKAVPDGATSATVTGLANGTSYTFTVTATNAAGTSPDSTPSNAVTPDAFTHDVGIVSFRTPTKVSVSRSPFKLAIKVKNFGTAPGEIFRWEVTSSRGTTDVLSPACSGLTPAVAPGKTFTVSGCAVTFGPVALGGELVTLHLVVTHDGSHPPDGNTANNDAFGTVFAKP